MMGRPLKVLHVISGIAPQLGGPSVAVLKSAEALVARGVESTIYATDLKQPSSWSAGDRLRLGDIPCSQPLDIRLFPRKQPHRVSYAPGLGAAIRRNVSGYDVVHIHALFLYPQFAAWRAARAGGVPFVVAPCGALEPFLRTQNSFGKAAMGLLWQRRMLAEARFIHFKTAGEMESAADVCGPAPATVVPNGIDWEAFQNLPAPQAAKQLIAGDRDARIVLFLGRIARIKRVDLLIRAFARTRAAKEECHLVVAGPDDEGLRPSLQALAAELGIGDRVRFVGMLDPQRRAAALAAADIWALPSHTENFGVAVLEALAAGCACLVSPHVKVATHAEKRGAVAISPLDATAWTREIDALLANNERREKLGAAGRTFARLYDWPLVAQKLRAMYELAITPSSA